MISEYTETQLRSEANRLRQNVRQSLKSQGLLDSSIFEKGFLIRLGEGCPCVSVKYTVDGVTQYANCAI